MHNRVEQEVLTMLLEEFRKYNPPEGWKLMHVSGHEQWGWPGSLDKYFEMSVVIQKGR